MEYTFAAEWKALRTEDVGSNEMGKDMFVLLVWIG
jgi:hypothetical protein